MIQNSEVEDKSIRFKIIFLVGTLLSIGLPILLSYATSIPVIGLIGISIGVFSLGLVASFVDYKNDDQNTKDRNPTSSKNNSNLSQNSMKHNSISLDKNISKELLPISTNRNDILSLKSHNANLNVIQRS